eukprot:TRINITY_DN22666_c0_g4_i1.p1 TRINITY_DN22666_c0_g4~~TRINITY_DN22666_c0_g4_i1.p1  ORF type:complete len:297 (-),score=54.48 TRINITY_DN22666_c0_g4_i1:216-1046(-)
MTELYNKLFNKIKHISYVLLEDIRDYTFHVTFKKCRDAFHEVSLSAQNAQEKKAKEDGERLKREDTINELLRNESRLSMGLMFHQLEARLLAVIMAKKGQEEAEYKKACKGQLLTTFLEGTAITMGERAVEDPDKYSFLDLADNGKILRRNTALTSNKPQKGSRTTPSNPKLPKKSSLRNRTSSRQRSKDSSRSASKGRSRSVSFKDDKKKKQSVKKKQKRSSTPAPRRSRSRSATSRSSRAQSTSGLSSSDQTSYSRKRRSAGGENRGRPRARRS